MQATAQSWRHKGCRSNHHAHIATLRSAYLAGSLATQTRLLLACRREGQSGVPRDARAADPWFGRIIYFAYSRERASNCRIQAVQREAHMRVGRK